VTRVLVVEDSSTQRVFLTEILRTDPAIEVVGAVTSGREALAFLAQQKPDVVTMDLRMPDMNGLEVTRRIMETYPVPVVIVSAYWDVESADLAFRAMEAGAVAGVSKPTALDVEGGVELAQQFLQTVKLMAEVKVIRRWPRVRHPRHLTLPSTVPPSSRMSSRLPASPTLEVPAPARRDIAVVVIGASTGGPPVLRTILAGLPKNLPVPILIVQHIAKGFLLALIQWLQNETGLPISRAAQGEKPLPGHVYFAPDEHHMGIALNKRIALVADPPEYGLRPAVSYLFRSAAAVYGGDVVAALLTGMGKDGAEDLRLLREKGAITIAQNKETSVVHGMPGAAIALDAASYVLAPEGISPLLTSLVQPEVSTGDNIVGTVHTAHKETRC